VTESDPSDRPGPKAQAFALFYRQQRGVMRIRQVPEGIFSLGEARASWGHK
jgi:hypothetical protein